MDINATLFGQFITFAILVWVTLKYVWPPVLKTLQAREAKVIEGLEAAARSKQELEAAEHKVLAMITEAKQQAGHIIEQANLHAAQLIEDAKAKAKFEGRRIVELAEGELGHEVTKVREELKRQVAMLAVAGAEKIIRRNLDANTHNDLLEQLVAGI